ncbi:TadE family type IV pilus minor pilin [Marmoricola sp. RAF53]|uniref:TadE family type IV pilus minor pilin n=1 Tax=Marmoricola sp. RAF53 TaxID=3233059 RepID=UPI003F992038
MTAEAAVVLPVLVVVAAALAWTVSLGVAQVRATDAARETARALARDDDRASAIALGHRVAPDGARISVSGDDTTVTVTVEVTVRPGGGLLGLPGYDARATAVAAREGP